MANILLTGANGYIGQRLLPVLLEQGHTIYCCVRHKKRFNPELAASAQIQLIEIDFSDNPESYPQLPPIEAAYYLMHAMAGGGNFAAAELKMTENFLRWLQGSACKQIIYLSGIVNAEELSPHLQSRLRVEKLLQNGSIPLTVLRAAIIVGSGSASFEIIRDLVEKLPIMVAPKWLNTKCQPLAIRNVIELLTGVLLKEQYYNQDFDIAGPDVLSYKEMLLRFARIRGLKRIILIVPLMTPRLSSYWLYLITSTSYPLAVHLVESMKVQVVARPNNLAKELNIKLLSYNEAVKLAFEKIEQNLVASSWKDAFSAVNTPKELMHFVTVPEFGCYQDRRLQKLQITESKAIKRIWSIGGLTGWYYGDILWGVRGFIDRILGGVGLRRGRRHPNIIHPGDALDFWRVIVADKEDKRLLLYAEMKLPGEAWLEFKIISKDGHDYLQQTATFRPKGLLGRLYWYSMLPFHHFLFNGMAKKLVTENA